MPSSRRFTVSCRRRSTSVGFGLGQRGRRVHRRGLGSTLRRWTGPRPPAGAGATAGASTRDSRVCDDLAGLDAVSHRLVRQHDAVVQDLEGDVEHLLGRARTAGPATARGRDRRRSGRGWRAGWRRTRSDRRARAGRDRRGRAWPAPGGRRTRARTGRRTPAWPPAAARCTSAGSSTWDAVGGDTPIRRTISSSSVGVG